VRERSAEEISKAVCQAVQKYVKGAPANDDVTVVIVKNVGTAGRN
jgi:serine phosphatase RsbU (regulator of sigma subunit)